MPFSTFEMGAWKKYSNLQLYNVLLFYVSSSFMFYIVFDIKFTKSFIFKANF